MKRVLASAALVWVVAAGTAGAQTGSSTPEDRPATSTDWGDTGLWFVPTGEVLPAGRLSFSFARTESDFEQGFTDVSSWPVSIGVGLGDRAEIFGSLRVVTRIDRDTTPLFFNGADNEPGGLVNEFPGARQSWSGNQLGDLLIGGKASLLSEQRQNPLALAIRGTVKLPTADEEEGAGTGKMDWFFDAVASKEIARRVELAGFTGLALRGDPVGLDLSNGLRWGIGAGFPSRSRLRLTTEFYGEYDFHSDVIAAPGAIVAADGTSAPFLSSTESPINVSAGITWQSTDGLFFNAGLVYAFGVEVRGDFLNDYGTQASDAIGFQFRLGWHRGLRAIDYAPEPAPAPVTSAPAPGPAPNRNPTARADCEPCTVESGRSVSLRVLGQDPDGDPLSYRWSTAAGKVSDPTGATATWTAPTTPGPVALTVTVNDGRGGIASDTVTIDVREPAVAMAGTVDPRDITFEDVHFDFDRYTLRPEATELLNGAITTLRANPVLRLTIEGHTCNIGTSEYNLALGERRAIAVRQYLTSRGISGERLNTVSYGEERPKHDNSTDPPRRLNRRAALVVRVQR
jgi:peptidoglycan-associated lipoprotein